MKFLLDECVPVRIQRTLQDQGHEVFSLIGLNQRGIKNGAVATFAITNDAIIVTRDEDFLHLKRNLQQQCRVIYIKIHPPDPHNITVLIEKNLEFCINSLQSPGVRDYYRERGRILPKIIGLVSKFGKGKSC